MAQEVGQLACAAPTTRATIGQERRRVNTWLQLIGGALLLYFGAEWFVGGASELALSLRVPRLLIGLTVVAYGTSAPEVVVGVEAVAGGHGEVALANVIGSNIANIGLILGCAALIRPARVDGALRRRELPVLILSTALLPLLLLDGTVTRFEAGLLLAIALTYTGWMVRVARTSASIAAAKRDARAASEAADIAGAPGRRSGTLRAVVTTTIGLGVLLVGGNQFVVGAVALAQSFGMSERLVGLTIVAIGTSLPELVTSIIAARRGHSDLAVGNVVGSNIFNVLLCLGAACAVGRLVVPLEAVARDLVALGLMTGLAAFFIRTERTISRIEGGIMLALYIAFMAVTVATS
jgi:cation:H+ antiporter